MKIVWSRKAVRQLSALREYIQRDSEQNAAEIARRIITATDLLASQPLMGRIGRVSGTRELVVPATPYVVAYRIQGESLELIAVLHGRQQWPSEW